jgi:LDH2 family malate/lactate/ureidoglycolate dehydrogenase
MLGIVMCNASPSVPPWQGREPRWGTNPICVSMPGNAWLLDMATTTVAQGRIYKAKFSGQDTIPFGWAMDADGVPTTSTAAALKGLLMPLGGYKGSGLAMMVEILCGVLSGGAISTELGGLRFTDRPFRVSQFFLALDISRLMPLQEFETRLRKLVAMAKSARPAPDYDEVLVAGEPEWRAEADYLESGVPLTEGVWEELRERAGRLGIPTPPVLSH